MTSDLDLLIRDKYDGNAAAVTDEDRQRLASGEPLAYIIGWIPFLGLRIHLDSHPLIPRPETEWWTEKLIAHLRERFGENPFSLLDLCAGSGAIGLSILKVFPNAHISFGEIDPTHAEQIRKNIEANALDTARATIRASDLFDAFTGDTFDIIACNPPYIPDTRELDASVRDFEPTKALYSGADGLELIRRITTKSGTHLNPGGELWMETDTTNADETRELLIAAGARSSTVHPDLYGRPRLVVTYYP